MISCPTTERLIQGPIRIGNVLNRWMTSRMFQVSSGGGGGRDRGCSWKASSKIRFKKRVGFRAE
uniref:Uncharacterized protein n=1 Tax=Anguilla anguilla TaxID=7936 RepID=A0A0E9W7L2_ANGAN